MIPRRLSSRRSLSLLLTVAGLLLAVSTAAVEPADWPAFRGEDALGIGTGATVVEWDGESGKNVLWKVEVPGLGHSSPVIHGDRLYVTTAVSAGGDESLKVGLYGDIAPVEDDSEHEFKVLAFDKRSGELLWERVAHRGVPKVKRHTKSTHANSTPATDGEHLVVFFGSEGLYTYDLDGELLWKKDFGVLDSGFFQVPSAQWGFASSPVIHEGRVIVQVDVQENSFVAAFDVATGEQLWRTPREDVPTWSTPAVVPYTGGEKPGWQVVVNGWKHIGGYDLETGRELWKLEGGGDIPVPTPIFHDGVILITNAHGRMRPIYAIRTDARGTITPESEAVAWWHDRAGNYMQTPIVVGDLAYFCMDNGVLSVYELETGERLWQERLGGGQSGFSGSPVAAGDKLYFTSESGDTWVLQHGREYRELAKNELGETFMSTPAISDGVLYFRARTHLFAIGNPPAGGD